MHHGFSSQQLGDRVDEAVEVARPLGVAAVEKAGRDLDPVEIAERFGGALVGQMLAGHEVGDRRADVSSVAGRGGGLGREGAGVDRPAPAADLGHPVLGHLHHGLRHVEDLTDLLAQILAVDEVVPAVRQ